MDYIRRRDYHQIAVVDAMAVLGPADWHALDISIGLATMEAGLRGLHEAGLLEDPPSRALAIVLFGALNEAALAASRGDADPDELMETFTRLVDRVGPEGPDV